MCRLFLDLSERFSTGFTRSLHCCAACMVANFFVSLFHDSTAFGWHLIVSFYWAYPSRFAYRLSKAIDVYRSLFSGCCSGFASVTYWNYSFKMYNTMCTICNSNCISIPISFTLWTGTDMALVHVFQANNASFSSGIPNPVSYSVLPFFSANSLYHYFHLRANSFPPLFPRAL